MPNQLYTVKEVASMLHVSISSVYALVERGLLAAYRIGVGRGAIRISNDDLDSFLESCRVQSGEQPPVVKRRRSRELRHIRL